jgi:transposase
MPAPTPLPLRQVLLHRARQGQSATQIAHALGLAPRTVRHLLHRLRHGGDDAVAPSYARPSPPDPSGSVELREPALQLRREHPAWGAGLTVQRCEMLAKDL